MNPDESLLTTALLFPWNDGESGTTLVGGGILTLLSPLLVPALLVLGYDLRVVEAVLAGEDEPPVFEDWGDLFVDGLKAAVVLFVYVAVPLLVGGTLLVVLGGLAGGRFMGGVPPFRAGGALGVLGFVLVLLLGGLALLVWYLAPAALVHLARTRRLRAAFVFDDVRKLARADSYGSAWLLALAIFAGNAVVLLILNAAGVGVLLSGFISFYAFLAMAFLYAQGAQSAGFDLEQQEEEPAAEAEE